MISKGLLFHVTFNIIATGFGQVHVDSGQLVGHGQKGAYDVPTVTEDGFYDNAACPSGSTTPCKFPLVTVRFSPLAPSAGTAVTFNVTAVVRNANAVAVSYTWDWGDGSPTQVQTNLTRPMAHLFAVPAFGGLGGCVSNGNCSITVSVADSANVVWETTIIVPLKHLFVQLTVGEVDIDHQFNANPGTLIHIIAHIVNTSTIAEKASLNITVDGAGPPLNAGNFTLQPAGGTGSLNATWDTTGKVPRVYGIFVTIGNVISAQKIATAAHPEGIFITFQNDTTNTQRVSYVLLILPMVTGSFSLNLLQSVGLGTVVLLAAGAGLVRFLRKPSYESEPL
jgi:hypothetical protein